MNTEQRVDLARTITKGVITVVVGSTIAALIKAHALDENSSRTRKAQVDILAWTVTGLAVPAAVNYGDRKLNAVIGNTIDVMSGKPIKPTTT